MTTNDELLAQVLAIHDMLIGREDYRALLRAATDEEAVYGDFVDDDAFAAMMIHDKAAELGAAYAAAAVDGNVAAIAAIVERRLRCGGVGWERRRPIVLAREAEAERQRSERSLEFQQALEIGKRSALHRAHAEAILSRMTDADRAAMTDADVEELDRIASAPRDDEDGGDADWEFLQLFNFILDRDE